MLDYALEINNLNFKYPHQINQALKNIGVKIKPGEFLFITGKSGCGKSTLARCLNGIIPHIMGGEFSGEVLVKSKNTLQHEISDLAQDIGFIFQNPESQFFTVKVEDELAFAPENMGLNPPEIEDRIEWALNEVEMGEYRFENVFNLSEGQKQRIAVAANLTLLPDILVLDEPTSNLDPPAARKLFKILGKLQRQNKTIILIDHRTNYALQLADRVLIMDQGEIVQDQKPDILLDEDTRKHYGIRNPQVLDDNFSPVNNETKPQKPLLNIFKLHYSYGNGFSLDDINLHISPGEVLGVVGANGSGKTTLAKVLAGILKPDKGSISWSNDDSSFKVGMIFQNPDHQLFMDSVYNELNFGLEELKLKTEEAAYKIDLILNSMNLAKLKKRHPHSLSGGEKQRTLISAFLVREPHLLIMDEPTTGMDYYHMQKVVREINRLQKEDLGIMIISHDLEFLQQTTTRLVILSQGKLIKEGPTEKLLTKENLRQCFPGYHGLSS